MNQIYHFWAYLNTVSQGGIAIATVADIYHECNEQGTLSDARLTTLAFRFGEQVSSGSLSPQQLASQIRITLKSPFSEPYAPHYYSVSSCAALRLGLHPLPSPSSSSTNPGYQVP